MTPVESSATCEAATCEAAKPRNAVSKVLALAAENSAELRQLAWLIAGVLLLLLLPGDEQRVRNAAGEAVALGHWYAREHVVLCLIPALFIAGAIGVFVRQSAVMRLLGPKANKPLAYGVASVSGTILSVCSCTVLPLFAGIWRMGAGLGPAMAFLFSGPAINVLAIVLTARVLGIELGIARAVGAVIFSVVIGVLMALIFRRDSHATIAAVDADSTSDDDSLWPGVTLLVALVAVLIFANWSGSESAGFFGFIAQIKWWLVAAFAISMGVVLTVAYQVPWKLLAGTAVFTMVSAMVLPAHVEIAFVIATIGITLGLVAGGEKARQWLHATWEFTKQIVPLLLIGVLVAGFLLGRPGHEGLIPSVWVERSVGGSSIGSSFFAAVAGTFMYFATLTEVPILQGLIGSGMGRGPALALLLAGPALSLPSMLALRQIMGTKKTAVYVSLVIVMATASGFVYGLFAG